MFYIILVIAGIALAANRKQQTAKAAVPVSVAHDDTTILPHVSDMIFPSFRRDYPPLAGGPGIGAPLSANNPAFSDIIIVSGPTIYRPDKGGAPASAPAGGGTSAGAAPSATGSGGVGPAPPRSPYIPNTL